MSDHSAITRERIRQCVCETLQAWASGPDSPLRAPADDLVLFGPDGCFDSTGLVGFLADLEYHLSVLAGRDVVVAEDRAMSRARSPFRTVAALVDYLCEQLKAE